MGRPRKIKEVPVEQAIPVLDEPKEPVKTEAKVMTKSGQHVRTYTHAIHGKHFLDLAHQKASQNPEWNVVH